MYDYAAQRQIQYYYCLALARKHSQEFDIQVDFFKENNNYVNYNFLKGFNYRISGKLENAENSFRNVLSKNGNHYRSKRELVTVYRLLD